MRSVLQALLRCSLSRHCYGIVTARPLCSKITAGGSLRFPNPAAAASASKDSSSSATPQEATSVSDPDDLLDYDEYVEYLGDEDGGGAAAARSWQQRSPEADAAAAASRRRQFLAECPVDGTRLGLTGVIDPEELVALLRHRNARDIVVVTSLAVSASAAVDSVAAVHPACLVVCTGRSSRHLLGLAEYTLRVYKSRLLSDPRTPDVAAPMPPIEAGANPNQCNWAAVDLGNCGLHCFLPDTRARYDLEALWCLGPELDPACREAARIAREGSSRPRAIEGVDWDEVARLAAAEKLARGAK